MKEERKICRDCGKEITGEFVEIDGEYLCEYCVEENYFYCDDCGRLEHNDYGYWIESAQKIVCEDCLDNNYFKCGECGEYHSLDESNYYIKDQDYTICDDCYCRGGYGYCEDCDNFYSDDYIHYHERTDRYYCDDCYPEDLLYDYHDFSDWNLFRGKNEEYDSVPYYIGKEIELEPKGCGRLEDIVCSMENNINAVGMYDGSLTDDSVEVVTHPESWEYLQEHKENYKKFFRDVEYYNYGDYGDAGLHFHITRPDDNVIARIIVIMESFKDEIIKLSRRSSSELNEWASFMSDNENNEHDKMKFRSTKYLKEEYLKKSQGRYRALNLSNYNTIEFRFFNGANNFEEFWGALQFIHNLMEIARQEERDINTITWKELLTGEELQEQARKLELLDIDKTAKDTTEIIEKFEKIEEETKNSIKKTLENLIKYLNKELSNKSLESIRSTKIDEIEKKSTEFMSDLSSDLRYLNSVISIYKQLNYYTIKGIKSEIGYVKNKKYSRYFKQIEKQINKFESEVR